MPGLLLRYISTTCVISVVQRRWCMTSKVMSWRTCSFYLILLDPLSSGKPCEGDIWAALWRGPEPTASMNLLGMWVHHLEIGASTPGQAIRWDCSPGLYLTTTSWATQNQATQVSCLWISHPQKSCDIINVHCHFKMLKFGVICYVATDNNATDKHSSRHTAIPPEFGHSPGESG